MNAFKGIQIVVVLGCVITVAITAFLPSTTLSFNESCEIASPIQKLKSAVQGQRYWVKQLQLLDEEVRYLEAWPVREAIMQQIEQRANVKMTEVLERAHQSMEEIYSKYPKLRPSAAETMASTLRARADAIERADMLDWRKRMNADRIESLVSCRPAVIAATVERERTANPNQ